MPCVRDDRWGCSQNRTGSQTVLPLSIVGTLCRGEGEGGKGGGIGGDTVVYLLSGKSTMACESSFAHRMNQSTLPGHVDKKASSDRHTDRWCVARRLWDVDTSHVPPPYAATVAAAWGVLCCLFRTQKH
jgi:hypothetical protein